MKKRIRLSVFLVISLLFLVGWGKKRVELLNDKKLIDLNRAIGLCMAGADVSKPDRNTDSDTPPEGNESQEVQTDREGMEEGQRTIIIRVRDEKVTYDSIQWSDLNRLKDRIRKDYHDTVSLRVVDDFAEAHVYRRVIEMLSELESEIGLIYTEE